MAAHRGLVLPFAVCAALVATSGAAVQDRGGDPTFATLIAEGEQFEQKRDFTAAIARFERAARLGARKGRAGDQAWALTLACRSEWFADRPLRARPVCEEALRHARAAPLPKAEAEAEKILAVLDGERSDYASSDRRMQRAVTLSDAAGEKEILLSALNNWSATSLERGRVREALERSRRALTVLESFPGTSARMQFAVPFNLAKAFEAAGDDESARSWLDVAARSAESHKLAGGLHHVLMESALLLLRAGDLDGAGAYYERAIAWNQSTPGLEVDIAFARRGLAATQEARGRFAEALAGYDAALEVIVPRRRISDEVETTIAVGRCLAALGRFAEADQVLRRSVLESRRAGLRMSEEMARLEHARLLEVQTKSGAGEAYSDVATQLKSLGLPSHAARAYAGAARVAERAGAPDLAEKWILEAVEQTEEVQTNLPPDLRWRFLETAHEVYAAAYRLRMRRYAANPSDGEALLALAIIDRERSRDLMDVVGEKPRFSPEDGIESPKARIARLQLALLSELPTSERQALLRERADAERDLMLRSSEARPGRWAGVGKPITETQSILGEDEAVLTYTLDEPAAVFVLTRVGVRVALLNGPASVRSQISLFGGLSATGRIAEARALGLALAQTLLAPALDVLPQGTTRLVIAATGELSDLPWSALPNPRLGDLLLNHFEVTYVPTLQLLAALRVAGRPISTGALVFADPLSGPSAVSTRRGAKLGPLPHALQEGRDVAGFFEAPRLLEGPGATPRAVVADAGRYGVLHFATHAVTDRLAPHNSALVLAAEDTSRTGWLTAREISALSLDASLVTLSSCQSSAGPRTQAASAPSLARAFLYAGSRAVVAGLWDVDDAVTRTLMGHFYEELARGSPVGAALRRAQQTLARTKDASHWAGFVVVGDPLARPHGLRPPIAPARWAFLALAAAAFIGVSLALWRRALRL